MIADELIEQRKATAPSLRGWRVFAAELVEVLLFL
jgi:hypothetical protein